MFRVALPRKGAVLLAALIAFGGVTRLLRAQPGATPVTAHDAGPIQPDAAPVPDPLPAAPTFDAQLVSVLRNKDGSLTLIGSSGQQYESAGELAWQRAGTGGVSVSVSRVFRGGNGKLFAVGNRAPLFSRKDGLWAGYSLARKGPAAASTGSAPIIALRRQLYELGAVGWRALAVTPAIVQHLWAASSNRVFFADRDGKLWAGRGGGWQKISITLAPNETIAQLHGVAGKLAVALTSRGRLFLLDKRVARLLRADSLGSELRIEALGVVEGTLMAAARHPNKTVLLKVGTKALAPVGELWPVSQGDKFSIITEHPKGILVGTKLGQIRVRLVNGAWKNASIANAPVDPTLRFPHSGPAKAR